VLPPGCSGDGSPACECVGCDAVRFFPTLLSHSLGQLGGQPFHLEAWQQDFVRRLFGTLRPDGTRQYRTAFLAIPRKNGKSTLCAGIALRLMFDGEPGAKVYSCGADRQQARLVFDMARSSVHYSALLRDKLEAQRFAIARPDNNSSYEALSAEAGTKHGLNAHGVIFDELHAQPDRRLVDVMATSMGARSQPLLVYITTAGFDRKSVCWEIWKYAEAVRDGAIIDDTFLPVIYAADPTDDWKDEATWRKANPNLGVSINLDFLRSECARAVEMPSYENTFRQLYLNQWTEQDTRWLRMDHWAQGNVACPVDLAGRECFAGLDLATTYDTTAFVLLFPLDDGTFWVEPHFWIPADNATQRERRDRVPYLTWKRQGHMRTTDGNVTDFKTVMADIVAIASKYRLRGIGLDPWNATMPGQELQGMGLPMQDFRQGYGSLSGPSKLLENWVVSGKVRHGGHPVLSWQASNVAIQRDAAGNIKPNKDKSSDRIDGIVSLVMAIGLWQTATATAEQSWDLTVL